MKKKIKEGLFIILKIVVRIAIWVAIVAGASYLAIKSGVDLECP